MIALLFAESASGFNCTFMELKYKQMFGAKTKTSSFNCTFMELKLVYVFEGNAKDMVLIVPLWN